MSTNILFPESSFCFTGAMAHLKRKQAEQEVRARGGHAVKSITPYLDYLVVGSRGSDQWKHGNYGNKIAAAQELIADGTPPFS